MTDLARYRFDAGYVPDVAAWRRTVLAGTVVPYQVEFHPGPDAGRLCWLRCPHCYGGSARDSGERLPLARQLEILNEIADGGVRKIVFAGYATDPLNFEGIEDLIETAQRRGLVVGIHTKALRVSDRLCALLANRSVVPGSYLSVSVDAGSGATYAMMHGLTGSETYYRVLANVRKMAAVGCWAEIAATYLVTRVNADITRCRAFVQDFATAGTVDVIRFSFPQVPQGHDAAELGFLDETAKAEVRARLETLAVETDDPECRVLVAPDAPDAKRTLPCAARFVFPTVGFDGWLYPCSQTAAPAFRALALGNLAERGFWDLYRAYDTCSSHSGPEYAETGCRCDRKAHRVNAQVFEGQR